MKNIYEKILSRQNTKWLFALNDEEKQEFVRHLYDHLCGMRLGEMNHAQRTLYLAIRLEDTCQADALPSLSEDEELFLALPEMRSALEELGAVKTADLLGEFISLLPVDSVPEWSWFFSEERTHTISDLDRKISNYPDGPMAQLYTAYLSKPGIAAELIAEIR